jgi:hypothetical protein
MEATTETLNPVLEMQLGNGMWTQTTKFSLEALAGASYRNRAGLQTVTDAAHAAKLLTNGFTLRYGSDWYDNVRRVDTTAVYAAPTPPFTCPTCGGHRSTTLAGRCDDCDF